MEAARALLKQRTCWAALVHPAQPSPPPSPWLARRSVEFHRGGELLLTAGLDRRVRLFSVDGVK